jgi:hypothetical protein
MYKDQRIIDEVNKTMNVMDNIRNLEGNPFFYTRLKARLEGKLDNKFSLLQKFVMILRPIGIVALFLINIFTAVYLLNGNRLTAKTASAEATTIKTQITEDFRFSQNSYIYYNEKE